MDGFSTYPFAVAWEEKVGYDYYYPKKGDIEVGNDVWIATEATIMPGVKIGHGAIIGAKAVVTKDVPPYHIVAGNPASIIKKRFDNDVIEKLLEIEWWNWVNEDVVKNAYLIVGKDIDVLWEKKLEIKGK